MMKKLFRESSSVASAAVIVAVFSLLSRLVGFLRDNILAGEFGGKSDILDAYFAAFRIPDFLFQLFVVGALSASFIPIFTKYFEKDDQRAWKLTNNTLNILTVFFVVVSLLGAIFSPALLPLFVPGYSGDKLDLIIRMSRVMFLGQCFFAVSMVFGSVLQGAKRFFLYSFAPIVNNLGIILGALVLVPTMGPMGLAWGAVMGACLHAIIQAIGVFSLGYRYAPVFSLRDPDIKQTLQKMGPRVFGLAVNQINFLLMTFVASYLVMGSNGLLQFAFNLNYLPIGVVAVSYAIAVFPSLCAYANERKTEEFRLTFSSTVRQVLLFMIPATVLMLLLRAQIVRVVLGRGVFDWQDTILTANTLAFFAVSFIPQSLTIVLVRAYFALEDTITPVIIGVVGTIINVLAAFFLSQHFGLPGLALGFSISATVQCVLLWIFLRAKVGSLDERQIFRSIGILVFAGIVAACVTQVAKYQLVEIIPLTTYLNVFLHGLLSGIAGLIAYIGTAAALRSPEMLDFAHGMRRKLFREATPAEPIETRG